MRIVDIRIRVYFIGEMFVHDNHTAPRLRLTGSWLQTRFSIQPFYFSSLARWGRKTVLAVICANAKVENVHTAICGDVDDGN